MSAICSSPFLLWVVFRLELCCTEGGVCLQSWQQRALLWLLEPVVRGMACTTAQQPSWPRAWVALQRQTGKQQGLLQRPAGDCSTSWQLQVSPDITTVLAHCMLWAPLWHGVVCIQDSGMAWHGMTWALLKENMASKQRAREITSSATPWRPPATHTAAPVHVKVTRETCKGLLPDAENSWIWEQGWAGSYASRQLCGMNEVGASG